MNAITIRLDWPYDELSPNYRGNWRKVARYKHVYRVACKVLALSARDGKTTYPLQAPVIGHLQFITTAMRGYDRDNFVAWMKSGIDGVADAGIVENDRDIKDWTTDVVKGASRGVVMTLTELEPVRIPRRSR